MQGLLDGIAKATAASNPINEGDYAKDGLWYCGKCNTPKQCAVNFLGVIKFPFCLCKCEKEKRDLAEREVKRLEELRRISETRKLGFPDDEMATWTFDKDDNASPELMKIARNYVANFGKMQQRNKGLLLYGSVGTGKTFAACCIANALIDKGYSALVTNFARLANTLQGLREDRQDYIDKLNAVNLLVIDDLAAERQTEYMQETVFNIIDARYRSGRPLIITTNLTADELKNPADISHKRIYSRLFEVCIPFEVKGIDRRAESLKREYGEFRQLLEQ